MKLASFPRRVTVSNRSAAFTLIELLTVMAIILVLAGLILNIAGSAQYNSSKQRAMSEIKAFETAIESYKVDNGAYPENGDTDKLDPRANYDSNSSLYQNTSNFLYQELTGMRSTSASTNGKAYIFPKTGQLAAMSGTTDAVSTTSPNMYFVDPFGFSYGYSTIYLSKLAVPGATPPTDTGYNPTYDLWSTAGYSPTIGRATPKGMTSTAASYSNIWIKNW